MKYSFKIGSAWGIPIELHITFILLMAAVLVLSLPTLYLFVLILFLFVFVVLHELAHSLVARHYSIRVRKIVLYPIGGASEIEEISENPRQEWRMAVAGPLTSFAIGAVLLVVSQFITIGEPVVPSLNTAGNLTYDLAYLNLVLGAFNLIPAFPMDGGRVFRALLAERIKFSEATKYAAFLGRLFGILIAFFGLFFGFWLIIVGVFIYIGASEEAESTIVSTGLAGVKVRDVIKSEVVAVRPETTVAEALEVMFQTRCHDIVLEEEGAFYGIVTWNDLVKIKKEQRSQTRLDQLRVRHVQVFSDESVLVAYKIMSREKTDIVPVVDREAPSKIVGVVTSESVAFAYEKAKALS